MRIEGRCRECKREFPIDLVLAGASGGRCPFCATPLDANYSGNLAGALAALQRAGQQFEHALAQVRNLGSNLDLDSHTVLEPIRVALAGRAEAGRTPEI